MAYAWLLDIHTHMDLELELNTKLEEVVRHGTTTCIVGNCSIGAAYGSQRHKGEDPILTVSPGWRIFRRIF